jgi:HK97 family phage major capsid protein/HK97 family phage prohead protease
MNTVRKFTSKTHKRSFRFDGPVDAEKRTIELAFSSDVELERWAGAAEQLSHQPGACNLSRLNDGAPLLFNHDLGKVIGVVENARIDADGKGRAVVRFSRSAEAETVWQDVQDGILRNVSVGYRIKDIKLKESRDGLDVYEATKWEPFEISIVSVPADTSVGVGRSLETEDEDEDESDDESKRVKNTEAGETAVDQTVAPASEQKAETPEAEKKSEPLPPNNSRNIIIMENTNTPADGLTAERTRSEAILSAGEKYNAQALASEFVRSGKTVAEFKTVLLEQVAARNASATKESNATIGLSDKEARSFSLTKLFRALSEPQDVAARKDAAFEFEVCSAAAAGRQTRGTLIPHDVLSVRGTNVISNVKATTGYTGDGKNTVATELLAGSFIDVLRNKAVLLQNATMLAGLVGNVDIPKQTSKTSASWIGEDDSAPATDVNFGLVSLRAKTLAARSAITRRLLNQSSLGIEALVRENLARDLALALDYAGFYGDGLSNAPVGIKSTAGIGGVTFAGANPTFAELVGMETAVSLQNADVDSMAYISNAGFRGYAKSTKKFSDASMNTIWEQGNTVNGYNALTTNQVATGDVFFGNFSDLLVGMWGGLEVMVDPYTGSDKGQLKIVVMQDVDFAVRRAQSFVLGVKATA